MLSKIVKKQIFDGAPTLSHNLVLCAEEICCPICDKSLAIHPTIKKEALQRLGQQGIKNEVRRMATLRMSKYEMKDSDMVVSAICGHLFHRFCFRHYCYNFRQNGASRGEGENVICPKCFQNVSMSKTQSIDIRAHRTITTTYEKDFRHTYILHKELKDQRTTELERTEQLQQKIADARTKLDAYRLHEKHLEEKIKNINNAVDEKNILYRGIQNCNRVIDAMHKETIDIIRMYLNKIKDRSRVSLQKRQIPGPLIPFLPIITENESLLKKFGEVLRPLDHGGKYSDIETLIQEILNNVHPIGCGDGEALKKYREISTKMHKTYNPINRKSDFYTMDYPVETRVIKRARRRYTNNNIKNPRDPG